MDLYILRHAIAVDRGTPGYDRDSDRALTPEGEKKMRRIAEGMKAMNLSFDVILASPYIRAKQTADLVAEVFKLEKKLELSAALTPDGDPQELIDELNRYTRSLDSVLLVGHEPYLSELISTLLTGGPDLSVIMKKGGLCKLTADPLRYGQCATLQWLLTPRQLRRIP